MKPMETFENQLKAEFPQVVYNFKMDQLFVRTRKNKYTTEFINDYGEIIDCDIELIKNARHDDHFEFVGML